MCKIGWVSLDSDGGIYRNRRRRRFCRCFSEQGREDECNQKIILGARFKKEKTNNPLLLRYRRSDTTATLVHSETNVDHPKQQENAFSGVLFFTIAPVFR